MSSSLDSKSSFHYQPLAQSPPQNDAVVLVPVQAAYGQGGVMFMATTPAFQQNQIMMTPQAAPVTVSRPPSQFITPNSYFFLTVVLFVLLTIFAPETLFIMLPALIISVLSRHANISGNYAKAKRLGNIALGLNIFSIILGMAIAILIVSLTLSFHPWYRANDYYYYWGGCYYDYSLETEGSGQPPMICIN